MSKQTSSNTNPIPQARRAESGQAIVLMALVMIALLGMLGLAIDGGGLYFLWRDAQNATDAAVLSASYARCTEGNSASVISAGLAAAAKNGFDNNGTTNTVAIYNPPIEGEKIGNMDYIQVDISAKKPSYFIQMVYREPLEVTTRAVGFCSPPFDGGQVPGAWAGSLTCPNTFDWSGSTSKIIGPIFSNNEIKFSGSSVTLEDGEIQAVSDVEISNGGNVYYDLPDYPPQYPPDYVVEPTEDPLHLDVSLYAPNGAVGSNNLTYYKALIPPPVGQPSPDEHFTVNNKGVANWKPMNRTIRGLYYVEGNVDIGPTVTIGPEGITIVATGVITISGGINTSYYSEVMKPTANGVQYPGIVLASNYFDPTSKTPCGDNAISASGSTIWLKGVIYAPKSGINISGSDVDVYGSMLGNTINFGSADGYMEYDPSLLPPRPPSIQVAE